MLFRSLLGDELFLSSSESQLLLFRRIIMDIGIGGWIILLYSILLCSVSDHQSPLKLSDIFSNLFFNFFAINITQDET